MKELDHTEQLLRILELEEIIEFRDDEIAELENDFLMLKKKLKKSERRFKLLAAIGARW